MPRILLPLILLFLLPAPAHAVLSIDITRGQVNPLPIALLDFAGPDTETNALGADVAGVISADLESSGLFAPIDPRAFIQSRLSANTVPRFGDWRQINAQALVSGTVTPDSGGKVRIEFRLWDVLSEQQFAGKSFVTKPQNWRRVAHMIADAIYTRLTGEDGYFDSRIVYISEVQRGKVKIKRLAIMDQDGANHQFLTRGRELVLTPRFDPTSQQIIYLSYRHRVPSVHLYNLETGREELIGNFKGMSFAPRFSPDGKKAIMSVSLDGNSEIFELDLTTRKTRRLTRNPAIDTSPSYAPNGEEIVFNSNRGGSQQLYVMNRNGDNVRRISFGKGTYGTPVWSPRGDFIAFTKMHKGKFHIGVMRPSGKGERLLTESFLDEGPTWAPNGRVIMFFRQERGRKNRQGIVRLYSIDLTGYNEREIKTPEEASDPAWSPLLSTR